MHPKGRRSFAPRGPCSTSAKSTSSLRGSFAPGAPSASPPGERARRRGEAPVRPDARSLRDVRRARHGARGVRQGAQPRSGRQAGRARVGRRVAHDHLDDGSVARLPGLRDVVRRLARPLRRGDHGEGYAGPARAVRPPRDDDGEASTRAARDAKLLQIGGGTDEIQILRSPARSFRVPRNGRAAPGIREPQSALVLASSR